MHTNFVQDVRFSPSGENLASVGSDARIFIHHGAFEDSTKESTKEVTGDSHKGSIVGIGNALRGIRF